VVYPRQERPFRDQLRRRARRALLHERDHLDAFCGELREVPAIAAEHVPDGDCLIATAYQTSIWGADLPERCGRKFYLIQHYEKVFARDDEDVDATFRLPFRKIVISRWLQDIVEKVSGESNIPLIPNGRDFFLSTFDGEGITRNFDIGIMYSPVMFKRTDIALKALSILRERHPGLKIVMFGTQDPELDKYPDFPFKEVTFMRTPSQKQIRQTYLDTKVWMTASDTEGFCLPALEAISLGCPIVSSDNMGVRDIITDGVEGYIVSLQDPQALADRVTALLNDPSLRIRMATAALRRADDFSWERSTEMFEKVLTD
jgi:glycosyltransferase involved in cell wall biosynthesis